MDHTVNVWIGSKNFLEGLLICNIDLVEFRAFTAAEELDTVERYF